MVHPLAASWTRCVRCARRLLHSLRPRRILHRLRRGRRRGRRHKRRLFNDFAYGRGLGGRRTRRSRTSERSNASHSSALSSLLSTTKCLTQKKSFRSFWIFLVAFYSLLFFD